MSVIPVSPGEDPLHPRFDGQAAFVAYEHIRHRLPQARFPLASRHAPDLGALADLFDVFVFDAFGVLNVGNTAIPGAVERLAALKALGTTCLVVTNAASYDREASFQKFHRLGFDFPHDDIATSRQAAEEAVVSLGGFKGGFAVLGLEDGEAGELPFPVHYPGDDPMHFDAAEGFLFLSNHRWTAKRQALLEASLARRSRPVIIGNPDIIAPRETDLSTEPGYFGYRLAELGLGEIIFHGKPFPSVYDLLRRRHPSMAGARTVMIGDTLHTDVLGGASQGWATVLVSAHGLFKGVDVSGPIGASGIVPDFIIPGI